MMARVPTTHTPLSEAVIKAALAWHAEEIGGAGLTSDEFTTLARHWFALARVRQSERTTKDARNGIRRPGARVYVTQQDREEAGVTDKIAHLLKRGQSLVHVPSDAWDRLREMLLAGRLRGRLFSDDHGQIDIPSKAWGSSDADPAHERSAMRFGLGQSLIEGPAGIERVALEAMIIHGTPVGRAPQRPSGLPQTASASAGAGGPSEALQSSTAARDPAGRKNRAGAPKTHDPEMLLILASQLIYEGLTPKNQSELRRLALEAYSNSLSEGQEPPSDEWAKPIIRKLWNGLELDRKR